MEVEVAYAQEEEKEEVEEEVEEEVVEEVEEEVEEDAEEDAEEQWIGPPNYDGIDFTMDPVMWPGSILQQHDWRIGPWIHDFELRLELLNDVGIQENVRAEFLNLPPGNQMWLASASCT